MAIRPVDIPSAAGIDFGRGDVRHFSEDDGVDVVGLQTPTRHLAQRDNILAVKLNEVVEVVNNKEQFVPLLVPRTSVAPGTEEIVTNFAIPAGFEARVLNATVGSTPVTSSATLKIYYSNGYGNVTGTELVSTASTFSSGVAFYNAGEFIVALRNNGASMLEIAASITLTIRPIGSTAGLLVGTVVQGKQGLPGRQGDPGLPGPPGVGGAGTAGLAWKGVFNSGFTYYVNDAVSYTSGGVTQSYICILANPATATAPPNGTYWDMLASSGSAGSAGAGVTWRGVWSTALSYVLNDIASFTFNSVTSSYICISAVGPSLTNPPTDASHWALFAGPTSSVPPTYTVSTVPGLLSFGSDYAVSAGAGDYVGTGNPKAGAANTALTDSFFEASFVNNAIASVGVAFLRYQRRSVSNGTTLIILPQISDGASVDWLASGVSCSATVDGTAAATQAAQIQITALSAGTLSVTVNCAAPILNTLQVNGFASVV